jgi:hypothetical protein
LDGGKTADDSIPAAPSRRVVAGTLWTALASLLLGSSLLALAVRFKAAPASEVLFYGSLAIVLASALVAGGTVSLWFWSRSRSDWDWDSVGGIGLVTLVLSLWLAGTGVASPFTGFTFQMSDRLAYTWLALFSLLALVGIGGIAFALTTVGVAARRLWRQRSR